MAWKKDGGIHLLWVEGIDEPVGRIECLGHFKYPAYRICAGDTWISRRLAFTQIGPAKEWVERNRSAALAKANGEVE